MVVVGAGSGPAWIAVAILVVVVMGVLAAGAWWLTHLAWFPAGGAEESVVVALASPLWVGWAVPAPR